MNFVRYSREFVITVIVITEFDCILIEFVAPGDVQPQSRSQTEGRQVQTDQQVQSQKSGRASRQTEVGTDA